MVFWWIAGRGVDALVASRRKDLVPRIGWLETVVGSLLTVSGVVAAVAIELFARANRSGLDELAGAAGMWAILGGLTVAARIIQSRIGKEPRADAANHQV